MVAFFSHTIGIEFKEWGIYHLIPLLLIIVGVFFIYYYRKEIREAKNEKYFRYVLGSLAIITEITILIWNASEGSYSLDDLPIVL